MSVRACSSQRAGACGRHMMSVATIAAVAAAASPPEGEHYASASYAGPVLHPVAHVAGSLSAVPPLRKAALVQAQLQHLQRQPPSSRTSTAAMSNAASLRTTFSSVALSRTASMSFTQRSVSHSPRLTTFRSDDEDALHQQVVHFLRHHPSVAAVHEVRRISEGAYDIDGHQVDVEWQHFPEAGRSGRLVVVDGPMRQPFEDYLAMSEANAEYDTHAIAFTSALHAVPKERRMTFDDGHQKYSRLEAMRVAKEQASIREKAADYTRDGQQVPEDLVKKYNRTIQQKLRRGQLTQASISALVHADENKDPQSNREAGGTVMACAPATISVPPCRGVSYAPPATQASASHTPQIRRAWSGVGNMAPCRAAAALPLFVGSSLSIPIGSAGPCGSSCSIPVGAARGSSCSIPAPMPVSPMHATRHPSLLPGMSPMGSPAHPRHSPQALGATGAGRVSGALPSSRAHTPQASAWPSQHFQGAAHLLWQPTHL